MALWKQYGGFSQNLKGFPYDPVMAVCLFKGSKLRMLKACLDTSHADCHIIDISHDPESTEMFVSCWHRDGLAA